MPTGQRCSGSWSISISGRMVCAVTVSLSALKILFLKLQSAYLRISLRKNLVSLETRALGKCLETWQKKVTILILKEVLNLQITLYFQKKSHKACIFKTHCKDLNGSQSLLGNCKSQSESIWGQTFRTSWGWGKVISDDSSMMELDPHKEVSVPSTTGDPTSKEESSQQN